jgi:hypothetical protein
VVPLKAAVHRRRLLGGVVKRVPACGLTGSANEQVTAHIGILARYWQWDEHDLAAHAYDPVAVFFA